MTDRQWVALGMLIIGAMTGELIGLAFGLPRATRIVLAASLGALAYFHTRARSRL